MTSKLASEWQDDAKVSRPQKVTDVTASDEVIAKSASDFAAPFPVYSFMFHG